MVAPPGAGSTAAPTDLDALWQAAQARLRASVPDSTYKLWLEPLRGGRQSDSETLFLSAPEGIRAWAERRYSALIARGAGGDRRHSCSKVSFVAAARAALTASRGARASTPATPSIAS